MNDQDNETPKPSREALERDVRASRAAVASDINEIGAHFEGDHLKQVVKDTIEEKVDNTIDRVRSGFKAKAVNAKDASIEAVTRVGRSAKAASSELARRVNDNRRPIVISVLAVVGAGVLVWALRRSRRRASGPPEPTMRLSGGTPRTAPSWVGPAPSGPR